MYINIYQKLKNKGLVAKVFSVHTFVGTFTMH